MTYIGEVPTLEYLTARAIELGAIEKAIDQRRVTAKDGLYIRNIPNGNIVGGLAYNEVVDVLEKHELWCRIKQGWVSSIWLERIPS